MPTGKLKPEIIVVPDAQHLAEAGATLFEQTLSSAVQSRANKGVFILDTYPVNSSCKCTTNSLRKLLKFRFQ
jgi:hypothetical protein